MAFESFSPLRRWRSLLSWLVLAVMIIAGAIALKGCSPALLRSEAAQISQLVVSELSDPKTFNTVMQREVNAALGYMYDGLLSQNGLTGDLEPGLAESWEISDDNQTIVFTLRENLRWSDGEPLTVDDVIFSFNEVYFNDRIPSSTRDVLRVGEQGLFPTITKLDDRRFQVVSPEPFAPLLRSIGSIDLVPQHVLQTYVNSTDADGNPRFLNVWGTETPPQDIIGNGPFRLTAYQTGERIILDRNPYYWRQDQQGNPQPYIERIVIQIVESADTSLIQFRSGGLDIIGVSPNDFALIKREEEAGNFEIYDGGPALATSFISFNLNQGSRNGQPVVNPIKSRWFNTLEFRQAVAHAINRQAMLNNIYQGIGEPQDSPIYKQTPYYLSPEEGLRVYDYDPDLARELLLSAGFQYNDQGQLLDADGNLVRFNLITNAGNDIRESLGTQVMRDLAQIGITVDFRPVAFNTLVNRLNDTLDWDAHIIGFTGGGVEPNSSANIWSINGTLHVFNQNPSANDLEGRVIYDWEQAIANLYIRGSQELDEDRRREIYSEAQQLVQENLPFIYLVNPLALSAVRNTVKGVQFSALGGTQWNLYELQIEP
ncbi:MAG: ABC transporter substrate-binding protein [Kaiparowitsia implicata GSE-PSE-MK54-09C]|jgi:peptide/nickel transport system substrate-binding protein|nr:ABC transporter substrate-binding protein [Kaiparowitsia implicata GSE-PSE-MK54-09C]